MSIDVRIDILNTDRKIRDRRCDRNRNTAEKQSNHIEVNMEQKNLIQKDRLLARIEELSAYGKSETGGMNRFAWSDEEAEALTYLQRAFEGLGLDVSVDAVGNVFARYEGTEDLAPIFVGSHIDTVKEGGKYDGALGVLTALEAVQTLHENETRLRHPIVISILKEEEGSRFALSLYGSRAIAGQLSAGLLDQTDDNGIVAREEMKRRGFIPEDFEKAKKAPEEMSAYLELHIEQGKVLETEEKQIGVVTGIAGPMWLQVDVKGTSGHAGATPMRMRQDPMLAAAEMIVEIDKIAKSYDTVVATVGKFSLLPGSSNIIPASTHFTIDLRDTNQQKRDEAEERIRIAIEEVAEYNGCTADVSVIVDLAPVECDPRIMEAIERAASSVGTTQLRLMSGAGHDAQQIANVCPVGMIFVPSVKGYSHRPDEYTKPEDIASGAQVFVQTLLEMDQIDWM